MSLLTLITVQESKVELQQLLRKATLSNHPRLKMLLLIKGGLTSTQVLAAKTGVSRDTIANYKKCYATAGLVALLKERRGGAKTGAITRDIHEQIQKRLSDPKGSFTSYKQAQGWINECFGLQMQYHAVNKYLKYHFHTRLEVGRKTHVQKDPLPGEAFKKGTTR